MHPYILVSIFDVSASLPFQLCTTHRLQVNELRSEGEKSWVKRILHGSGPAAEIEDEEEVVEIEPQYMQLLQQKQETFIEK